MTINLLILLVSSAITPESFALDLPSIPNFLKANAPVGGMSSVATIKAKLLEEISFTNNGKTADEETQVRVLANVIALEKSAPPRKLLSDPKEAAALDGTWFLHYTSPSKVGTELPDDSWSPDFASEGESRIDTSSYKAKGSVSAAGISVDTSNRRTTQTFDVENGRVINVVDLDFGRVLVGGPFRESPNVPNRAIVGFEDLVITLNNGIELNLGFVFSLIALVRGTRDSGWLETTFLDSDLRIGRGNKGTMFVLTREADAVEP